MKPQIRRSAIALSITWGLASLMTLAHADTLKKPALDAIVAAQRTTGKVALPVASMPENFGEAPVGAFEVVTP